MERYLRERLTSCDERDNIDAIKVVWTLTSRDIGKLIAALYPDVKSAARQDLQQEIVLSFYTNRAFLGAAKDVRVAAMQLALLEVVYYLKEFVSVAAEPLRA